ncbi:MAG TPA: DJ-1/PfpI family protein [Gammaproteobacteria bacterium]|nr:DJ-1/PfpI family protein [Gammaproteobacteria bacterium]
MNTSLRFTLIALAAMVSAGPLAAEGPAPTGIADNMDSAPKRPIVVEFVVTDGADLIDFAGPAEVFNFVRLPGQPNDSPYVEYIVSDKLDPVKLLGGSDNFDAVKFQGGFVVTPNYTFDTAPPADLVFVGGQARFSPTQKELDWLRARHDQKQLVMSVCTGAYDLEKAGLLDGKPATTHHLAFPFFQQTFPAVTIVHGKRYVQSDLNLFTAGGLSSGIDLALQMVEMRFGHAVAEKTATRLEYQGTGWITNTSSF